MRGIALFLIFLRLGATSFGGPIAAIGYFREEFVDRKRWFQESTYADIVALCQLLPGPASSQVAITIGLLQAGYWGAIVSWVGFVMPSAIIMFLFGLGVSNLTHLSYTSWIQGAKIVAVAVVAQAILKMGKSTCPDVIRLCIAGFSAFFILFFSNNPLAQVGAILIGGILGWLFIKKSISLIPIPTSICISKYSAIIMLILFSSLLIGLPILTKKISNPHILEVFNLFFRTGSLTFGGGHVILPLLQSTVVPKGMVSNDLFLAGYGVAQGIPGSLLSFAAYIGTISKIPPNGWVGGLLCLFAIYLPSFLLITGLLPFWEKIRHYHWMNSTMKGLNAAVVGLLIAAFYNPLWIHSIYNLKDFGFACIAFLLLTLRWPAWLVVLLGILSFSIQ